MGAGLLGGGDDAGDLAAVAVGSDLYSILFYLGAGVLGGLVPFYTAAVVRVDLIERLRVERIGRMVVLGLGVLLDQKSTISSFARAE